MKQIFLCWLFFGTIHSQIGSLEFEILLKHLELLQHGIHEISTTLHHHVVGIDSCTSVPESGPYKLAYNRFQMKPTVLCDKASFDGGWGIVIQQRFDGSVDFNRYWNEYRDGFGIVGISTEFWLGLELIHQITSDGDYELVIELKDEENIMGVARYSKFRVGSEINKYRLEELGKFNGTADCRRCEGFTVLEDNFRHHLGQPFSTRDRDYDQSKTSCAEFYHGGWWFKEFSKCVLNGSYKNIFKEKNKCGIFWPTAIMAGKYSRMMIRRN